MDSETDNGASVGNGDGDRTTGAATMDDGLSGKTIATTTSSTISSLGNVDGDLDIENKKTFVHDLIWNH